MIPIINAKLYYVGYMIARAAVQRAGLANFIQNTEAHAPNQ